ncbi:hypothetical protein A33Q_1304 [Indibacter alkaliphilus LW1]|uniref:Uncharacterized protein n=1 Tax=Indibacter alkaliphilus (strain CCUG 57479 / KCTC 22604 / LW1) TaxID=1189612 RepID=S2DN60_INDAL|nr:hypothetical protein A33Q_1304 [Indibacter alkaliphilus LW1]
MMHIFRENQVFLQQSGRQVSKYQIGINQISTQNKICVKNMY